MNPSQGQNGRPGPPRDHAHRVPGDEGKGPRSAASLIASPERSPNWTKVRESVLLRANYRCVECGICAANSGADVHHLLPRSAGGKDEPSNLVTLCDGRHAAHHPKLAGGLARRVMEQWAVRLALWLDRQGAISEASRSFGPVLRPFGLERFRDGQLPEAHPPPTGLQVGRRCHQTTSTGALTPWSTSRSAKPPSRRWPPPSLPPDDLRGANALAGVRGLGGTRLLDGCARLQSQMFFLLGQGTDKIALHRFHQLALLVVEQRNTLRRERGRRFFRSERLFHLRSTFHWRMSLLERRNAKRLGVLASFRQPAAFCCLKVHRPSLLDRGGQRRLIFAALYFAHPAPLEACYAAMLRRGPRATP